MIVITGGIGCGKSTALAAFADLGRRVADADEVVHALYAPGTPLLSQIAGEFGTEILAPGGALNRTALAQRVFGDDGARRRLEELTHPAVMAQLREMDAAASGRLFAAVPLWYEAGLESLQPASAVIAVWCSDLLQHTRLRSRGWSDEHIRCRLSAQLSKEEKLRRADYGLINNGTLAELKQQCAVINRAVGEL